MVNTKKRQYILAVAILSTSTVSISKEISYDYIQGGYISSTTNTDTSIGDLDANGFGASGSFSVAPAIAITASYGELDFDKYLGIDVDATELTLGVTAHTTIEKGGDIFGNLSVLKADIEASNGISSDDTGYIVSIGLRSLVNDAVEIELGYSHVDLFDDKVNMLSFGIRFYASEKFSLGAGYSLNSDANALSLNARIDFK